MKRFLKKIWLGIPIGIILTILFGIVIVVAASWGTIPLTSTGTITVTPKPPPADYAYTLNTWVLAFPDDSVVEGVYFEAYATIIITNAGNQPITGLDIPRTSEDLPAGVEGVGIVEPTYPINPGGIGEVLFIVRGTPVVVGQIDLSGITFNFTPQY